MPITELIVNGTFSAGSSGWSGTDIEINPHSSYIPGSSTDLAAEIDGNRFQTTVLQQSFTVPHADATQLTFDAALRTAENNVGGDGFRVEILDSNGIVIATQDFFPTTHTLNAQTMSVSFPAGGTYTLRFTELGDNDSLGAIVDNVSLLVCFVNGTQIVTQSGEKPVEELEESDMILTRDSGFQPLRWIGSRRVTIFEQKKDPKLRPVVFQAGSLGINAPHTDLRVSRQHRMLISDWRSQLMFNEGEILTAAVHLVNGNNIFHQPAGDEVIYYHFMLDQHEVVMANGSWAESFLPTETSLRGLSKPAREEMNTLFPDLLTNAASGPTAARTVAEGRLARVLG
ncbi:Hint domain-containing protein [Halocynthiibacter sp.]|uniref:Hint domain-containing protein n=1 Tax=Halocynthiibacter sp. TaxID=1979210 RepID=UPI003C69E9E6